MNPLNFVADESLDTQIVDILADSFDVYDISKQNKGASDESVLGIAEEKGAILLTADKDFGELVYRQGKVTAGVILTRLSGLANKSKAEMVKNVINKHIDILRGNFVVISRTGTRIRSLLT
jgi:predicted nuclease of predicted toxin-antitoxin system